MKQIKRKMTILSIGGATFLGVMLITAQATVVAQSEEKATTTTTTTTTAGTISEFGPETIVVKTVKSSKPLRYTYTKTTTYVDEAGAPVSMEVVKSGVPVTVYYVKRGDKMEASKVIVRKVTVVAPPVPPTEVKKTTTTTTTEE